MDNNVVPNEVPNFTPEVKKFNPILITSLILLLVIISMTAGYFFGKKQISVQSINRLTPTSTVPTSVISSTSKQIPTQTLKIDETEGWKTYTNSNAQISFRYPSSLSEMLITEGGVSGPILGKPNLVISFGIKATMSLGTDAPFDGFSIYEVEPDKMGMLFEEYINKEVEAIKNSARGNPNASVIQSTIGSYIDSEVNIRRYFILSPNKKRIAVFSRINKTSQFINIFDQILSTFKFTDKTFVTDTSNWKTYINPEYGFEIKYPSHWNNITTQKTINEGNREFQIETTNKEYVLGVVFDISADHKNDFDSRKSIDLKNGKSLLLTYVECQGPGCNLGKKDVGIFEQILSTFKFTQ